MKQHKYGKILNVSSIGSILSEINTSNSSITSYSLQGLSNTLTREGAKYHININTLIHAPFDENIFTPSKLIPVLCYLIHDSCLETGSIIEASGEFVSKMRIQRASG